MAAASSDSSGSFPALILPNPAQGGDADHAGLDDLVRLISARRDAIIEMANSSGAVIFRGFNVASGEDVSCSEMG